MWIINVIVSVALISTFLGFFFFTYVAKVEQEIVIQQSHLLADNIVDYVSLYVSPETASTFTSSIQIPDMSENDDIINKINKQLKNKAYTILISLSTILLLTSYYLCKTNKIEFKEVMKFNFIILIAVSLVEVLFLNLVGRNYITVDMNIIKFNFLKNLREYISSSK